MGVGEVECGERAREEVRLDAAIQPTGRERGMLCVLVFCIATGFLRMYQYLT